MSILNPVAAPLDIFLQTLQAKYHWKDDKVNLVINKMKAIDVTTIQILGECWDEFKGLIPALGMQKMIGEELRRLGVMSG